MTSRSEFALSDSTNRHLEAEYRIANFAALLNEVWAAGWQPLDTARMFGADNPLALAVYVDALRIDRRRWHPRAAALWAEQADQLGAGEPWWQGNDSYWSQLKARRRADDSELRTAAALCTLVLGEPTAVPVLEAPPTEPAWGRGQPVADGVLAKVRALLAKAESTEFDEEAEALSAKAQELISRHSIDTALLAEDVDVPGGRRIHLDGPYVNAKFMLLSNIATTNGCRSCISKNINTATLFGHQSDMLAVEMLFTSLLLQGTGAVVAAGARTDMFGTSSTRSWRNAFWYGYADRIGQRLHNAAEAARVEHETLSGDDLLPVLAKRSAAVDRAFESAFPKLGSLRTSMSNAEGMMAGRDFGDRAQIASDNRITHAGPGELAPG